jgi:hypothetical protein
MQTYSPGIHNFCSSPMNKEVDFVVRMLIKKNNLTLSVSANIFIFVKDNKNPGYPFGA